MANRAARRARNLLGHRLWEQLQYIGETRIQALLSLAGDAHLAEQAIRAYDNSHVVDGHPQSAWPSSGTNSIPRFALLWIGMLHDYWMRQRDPTVVRESLPGMRSVLDWYRVYVRDRGIVRVTPGWRFVDWRPGSTGTTRSAAARDRTAVSSQCSTSRRCRKRRDLAADGSTEFHNLAGKRGPKPL